VTPISILKQLLQTAKGEKKIILQHLDKEGDDLLNNNCYPDPQASLDLWAENFRKTHNKEKWQYLDDVKNTCNCPNLTAYTIDRPNPPYYKYINCCLRYPQFCKEEDPKKSKEERKKNKHYKVWKWHDQLIVDLTTGCKGKNVETWADRMKVDDYKDFTRGTATQLLYRGGGLFPPKGLDVKVVGRIWKFAAFTSFTYDRQVAQDFISGQPDTLIITLKANDNLKGKFVSACSHLPDEKEFLALPGQCAIVTRTDQLTLELTDCTADDKNVFNYR